MVIGFFIDPIPQPLSYHHFADRRDLFGVANAWNVLSNISFALGGIAGLFLLFSPGRVPFFDHQERWFWIAVSVGLILTAIGSGYYHLAPDNSRLVWDRLPMVLVFMSYLAALIAERISMKWGLCLWPLLLCLGFYSVLQWETSELAGKGDLRLYLAIQILTILVTLILSLAPSNYDRKWDLVVVALFYGLAKIFEVFDHQIYLFSEGIISGHTLKHFSAAAAGIWLVYMIGKRKIVNKDKHQKGEPQ